MALAPAAAQNGSVGFPPLPSGSVVPYLTPKTSELAGDARQATGGVVLSGAKAEDLARGRLGGRAVLVDPATYSGTTGKNARQARADRWPPARPGLFDESEPQHGITVLQGGSLVSSGGRVQLAGALARPAGTRATPVVVALTPRWFRGAGLDVLIGEVAAAARPVALVFADPFNLLDTAGTVAGLVQLIREVRPVPVALLRCDISAVGAVAYGAALGAVGLTTSSRHCPMPGPRPRPGATRDSSPRLFVPPLLDYIKASRFTELVTEPDDPVWSCMCEACDGRSLLRFAEDEAAEEPDRVASYAHGGGGAAVGQHADAARHRFQDGGAGGQDGAVVRCGRLWRDHRGVSVVGQGRDEGVPAGAGADFGDHNEVGLRVGADPFRLPACPGRGGMLGVEGEQPHCAGRRLVSGLLRGEQGQLVGVHGCCVSTSSRKTSSSKKTSPAASSFCWSRPAAARMKSRSSAVSGVSGPPMAQHPIPIGWTLRPPVSVRRGSLPSPGIALIDSPSLPRPPGHLPVLR